MIGGLPAAADRQRHVARRDAVVFLPRKAHEEPRALAEIHVRSDVNFSESTRFFVRFSRQEDDRISPGNMPLPIGGGRQTTDHYTQGVADLTHVFSPSLVADAQFSVSRALATQYGMSQGFDVSSLAFVPAFTSQVVSQFPAFTISDVSGTANGSDNFLQFQPRNIWAARGSLSYLRGKHSLKFGGGYCWLHFN